MTRSQLDDVPGLGEKRKLQLLKRLGSVDAMRPMSAAELAKAGGIPLKVAEAVAERLAPEQAGRAIDSGEAG